MKTLIVGDVHAQALQLDRLLQKMMFSPEQDRLILLGDLIDRGNDAYGVMRRVIRLKDQMGSRLVIIRGSHEKLFLSSAWNDKLLWRAAGRCTTLRSFRQNGDTLSRYAGWIERNTVLYHEEDHFQCVHAAVTDKPLHEQNEHTLMMDHVSVKRNRYCGKLTITGHIHLSVPTYFDGSGGKGRALPYEKKLPLPAKGVICIDTGCGGAGCSLTGMMIKDGEYQLAATM